jgi:glycosyltransferase involved in cell wall biosynthesis
MKATARRWTIVVVGQSPKLASGQAKMIGYLLDYRFEEHELIHLPMNFSGRLKEMGRPGLRKAIHLCEIILKLWWVAIVLRCKNRGSVLYFPPAGPHLVPVVRDLALLGATRFLFERTVFHFHAAGLGEFREKLPLVLRGFYDWAYRSPDLAIATATSGLTDGLAQGAKANVVVYNGVPEMPEGARRLRPLPPPVVRLLFVGLLCEDKGIFVFLESLSRLKERRIDFDAQLIGSFSTENISKRAQDFVRESGISSQVEFLGELHGEALVQAYLDADVFCFPSFFAAESFGLVCVEAMRAGLPVVATSWRGIPEVVEDGKTGFIVPPRTVDPLVEALASLILNSNLRAEFGRRGRERYLSHFTVTRFCSEMDRAFSCAIRSNTGQTIHNERGV